MLLGLQGKVRPALFTGTVFETDATVLIPSRCHRAAGFGAENHFQMTEIFKKESKSSDSERLQSFTLLYNMYAHTESNFSKDTDGT